MQAGIFHQFKVTIHHSTHWTTTEKLVVPRAETYQPKIGIIRSFDKPKKSTELNEVENQGNLQINEKSLLFENYFEKAKDDIDVIEPEETKTMGMKLREKWEKFLDDIEWHEKSWFAKFTYFFEAPTILLRNLTIPKVYLEILKFTWNRLILTNGIECLLYSLLFSFHLLYFFF